MKELTPSRTAGINKENVRFCHNYYPVTYTGMLPEHTLGNNRLIRQYGADILISEAANP